MRTNNRSGKAVEERFWEKVNRGESDECWEWRAGTDTGGYGLIYAHKQQRGAHRVSYWLEHGEWPEDDYVLHHCDNKWCVNPDHLYLGDHSDNMQDAFDRGLKSHSGEQNPNSGLSEDDVEEIRELLNGDKTQYEIADEFGISQTTVSHISQGRRWADD